MPQNCSHWPWIYATDTPNTTIGYSFVIDLLEIWYTSLLFYPSLNDKKAFDFEEREVGVSDSGVYTLHGAHIFGLRTIELGIIDPG